MNPFISVILPTYNNQNTIYVAISSILAQTYENFELIVYNDGSMDNTKFIIEKFSDKRIIFVDRIINKGLPKVLNECLDLSCGEYIARMDADDICFPNRLEKQINFLIENQNIDLVGTRAITFDSNKNIIGLLPYRENHNHLVQSPWNNIPIPHPTWMARREWILKYRYAVPEIWRAEDQDLLLRAYKNSQYHCLPDVLMCYRESEFNLSKSFLARKSLLRAQIKYFFLKNEYIFMVLSIITFVIKTLKDIFFKNKKLNHYAIDDKTMIDAKELIEKLW